MSNFPNPASNARPHRRLSLLQPTQPTQPGATEAPLETVAPKPELFAESPALNPEAPANGTVRVMAYLSAEEARTLDETWLKLRAHPSRPSKSDILRAACTLAAQDFELLTAILLQQQSSTLSRQRSSKLSKK